MLLVILKASFLHYYIIISLYFYIFSFFYYFIISFNAIISSFISSIVLYFPKVIRIELLASFFGTPISKSTGEACINPALHAEPLDTQISLLSSSSKIFAPSAPSNETFTFPRNSFF